MPARRTQNTARRCGDVRRIAPLLLSGLLVGFAPAVPATAQPVHAEQPAAGQSVAAYIAEASQRFGIPEHWISVILQAESAGNLRADSSAGAMGLMQVMPETWAELRAHYGLGRDPFDPRDNILAGSAYLREMFDRYGNIPAMLAAYNAGPGRYDEYRSTDRPLPAETRAYVASLTPILLGERPTGSASAVARPLDWREAAIFVARDNGTPAADPAAPDRRTDDADPLVPAAQDALSGSQPEGMFVARNADGDRP